MKPEEFARVFCSEERIDFVNELPCVACKALGKRQRSQSDNHHTVSGGTGRKGPYKSLVPLCRVHHVEYHQGGKLTVARRWRVRSWIGEAKRVERLWREYKKAA